MLPVTVITVNLHICEAGIGGQDDATIVDSNFPVLFLKTKNGKNPVTSTDSEILFCLSHLVFTCLFYLSKM